MLKINKLFIILLSLGAPIFIEAALPDNISDLVEESAPAVVNITAKKAVSYTHLTLPTSDLV